MLQLLQYRMRDEQKSIKSKNYMFFYKCVRFLGKIETLSSGKLEIRDASNRLKGTYDPKSNETRDDSNRLVGKGNLLSSLL